MSANTNPANALNKKIKFTTTNLDNGTIFIEPFEVTGPNGSFNVPLNAVNYSGLGGKKVFIPLTTNTSEGANYLKIHLPQPGSDTLYVTFAKKHSVMADGYYDYISGIPNSYRTDLRNWILDGNSITQISTIFSKTLVFSAIGQNTNQSSQAIQFKIKFVGTFPANLSSPPLTSNF